MYVHVDLLVHNLLKKILKEKKTLKSMKASRLPRTDHDKTKLTSLLGK